MEIVKDHRTQK